MERSILWQGWSKKSRDQKLHTFWKSHRKDQKRRILIQKDFSLVYQVSILPRWQADLACKYRRTVYRAKHYWQDFSSFNEWKVKVRQSWSINGCEDMMRSEIVQIDIALSPSTPGLGKLCNATGWFHPVSLHALRKTDCRHWSTTSPIWRHRGDPCHPNEGQQKQRSFSSASLFANLVKWQPTKRRRILIALSVNWMRQGSHPSSHQRAEAVKAAMAITEENIQSITISMPFLLVPSC